MRTDVTSDADRGLNPGNRNRERSERPSPLGSILSRPTAAVPVPRGTLIREQSIASCMAKSRLNTDLKFEGIAPEEAFSVLGNEIRLDIVRALWEAGAANQYDDICGAEQTMSFTELRRRVDVRDNGKFNYHVSKLAPHFVRQTEDGYRLSGAGKRIARTVIAVSGEEEVDVSADLDQDCPLCGAAMTAAYEDQWLRIECTECKGLFGDETPEGMVYLANYPSAGLSQRSADEALSTGLFRCMLDQAYLMQGVCRECAGHVSTTLSVCESHDPAAGDPCLNCGTHSQVWADERCETCGFAKRLPIEICSMGLTPVISFLDKQGIDALAPTFDEIVGLLDSRFETAVSHDPLRVTITVDGDAGSLKLVLDETMTVLDIDRPAPTAAD